MGYWDRHFFAWNCIHHVDHQMMIQKGGMGWGIAPTLGWSRAECRKILLKEWFLMGVDGPLEDSGGFWRVVGGCHGRKPTPMNEVLSARRNEGWTYESTEADGARPTTIFHVGLSMTWHEYEQTSWFIEAKWRIEEKDFLVEFLRPGTTGKLENSMFH